MRNVANLINLSTPLGLLLAALGRGKLSLDGGLVIAEGVRLPLINASAMTVGCVVLIPGRSLEEAKALIPDLMHHEEQHAWQYAYCLGLPFLPLYGAAALWSMVRSGDRASANYFERQAGLATGGYPQRPLIPVREGFRNLVGRRVRR